MIPHRAITDFVTMWSATQGSKDDVGMVTSLVSFDGQFINL